MKIEEEIQQSKFKSLQHKTVVNIIYTANWINYAQSKLFKSHQLTGPQFNVLRILRGQFPKPCTVNLIIERMLDKSSNASRLVEKLKQKGLVSRVECPDDRRRVEVTITDKGLELLGKLDTQENQYYNSVFKLTAKEAKELNMYLDKLRS